MVTRSKSTTGQGNGAPPTADRFLRGIGPATLTVKGKATIVRRIAVSGDPKVAKIPKFECGKGVKRSVFSELDDVEILRLAAVLAKTDFSMAANEPDKAREILEQTLKQHNKANGTTYAVSDPCSMPGHISTGAGGCKPGRGSTYSLVQGIPSSTTFGTLRAGAAMFAFGYCVSITF